MKICILTPRFPFPENGGDVLRINNIARHLKSEGHELVLVSFYEKEADISSAKSLYDRVYTVKRNKLFSLLYSLLFLLCGKPIQCGYYYSWAYGKLFRRVVKQECPELYISHLLRMVPYLVQNHLESQTVVEMTDALSKTYGMSVNARGGGLKRLIYQIEKKLIARYERFVMERFPKVVLVSQSDIGFLNQVSRDVSSLSLHTNGVELVDKLSEDYDSDKICFIGNMRTLQNQDAVLHFVNDIFPLILQKIPTARFYVVGAEPPAMIQDLERRGNVVVTGFVDDLTAAIADSCVVVAPVQVAAGIQNKVLVAMAHGLPVVMSSLISRAIPELFQGENCVICDENQSFADACVRMMGDTLHRQSIAKVGYEMVVSNYSWKEKLMGYENLGCKETGN